MGFQFLMQTINNARIHYSGYSQFTCSYYIIMPLIVYCIYTVVKYYIYIDFLRDHPKSSPAIDYNDTRLPSNAIKTIMPKYIPLNNSLIALYCNVPCVHIESH